MFTKLNDRALQAWVSTQSKVQDAASSNSTSGIIPESRLGKVEMAVGGMLAYLLYAISVPALAGAATNKDQDKVVQLVDRFTNFIVILVAAISVLMGVWAALQFVGSGGNAQVAAKAKNTIKNVVIGLVCCAGIFILKNAILSVVGGAGTSSENKFKNTLQGTGGLSK